MSSSLPIKSALISVSNKSGIVEFAQALRKYNVAIISTGGTSTLLKQHGIAHTEIAEYTQFPEIFSGRLKTLHPRIHGGILARRDVDQDVMQQHGIEAIDLIVVNLYPFEQTINNDCRLAEAIENIDIGGPTLLRAAAKNYSYVTAVVDNADYPLILDELKNNSGSTTIQTRFKLAKKVFAHTARYDGMITNYLTSMSLDEKKTQFPEVFCTQYIKKQELRYGENPHQQAVFYQTNQPQPGSIAHAQLLQGKPLSYNNIADADSALECVKQFDDHACVIVKHANPCGVADQTNQESAYQNAFNTDPVSAFGGIIAFNTPLQLTTAKKLLQQFVEVIIAPEFSQEVLDLLQQKPNIRVLQYQCTQSFQTIYDHKTVSGGLLIQDGDNRPPDVSSFTIVTQHSPSEKQYRDAIFAWKVCKFVKSNAIVFAKDSTTLGIGAGQMSRVFSTRIAKLKAEDASLNTQGAVLASDAFFPFRDGVDQAVAAGVTTIIQPGGSLRDEEVIAAANEANIAMIFTHSRHFRH